MIINNSFCFFLICVVCVEQILLWMVILDNSFSLLASYASYSEGMGSIENVIIYALLVIFPFFVLFWKKWAFVGMVAAFFLYSYMAFNQMILVAIQLVTFVKEFLSLYLCFLDDKY